MYRTGIAKYGETVESSGMSVFNLPLQATRLTRSCPGLQSQTYPTGVLLQIVPFTTH